MSKLSGLTVRLRALLSKPERPPSIGPRVWHKPRSRPHMTNPSDWPIAGYGSKSTRLRLYRFLRDYVPSVKAAISTWAQLCNTGGAWQWPDDVTHNEVGRLEQRLDSLLLRIGPLASAPMAAREQMLSNLFVGLFTDGAFAVEILPDRGMEHLLGMQWIDPATIELRPDGRGRMAVWQMQKSRRVNLTSPAVYYQPLSAGIDRPEGSSLLSAVPFVARVEQSLISDLGRAMHNAGYARLHVRLTPPARQPGESDAAYSARAAAYFDDTVRQLRELEPDDNAVTWNDVEMATVEAKGRSSTQSGWFVNHRAMIEEICAATHLAPFMLGYSFGTTQSWGRFKYGMAMRMARHYQALAARFLEWLAAVELSLAGETVFPVFQFERPDFLQFVEEQQAEKLRTEVIVAQRDAGFLSEAEARGRLRAEAT